MKGTVSGILSDPPGKDSNVRFTAVPIKPLTVYRVESATCENLSNNG